MLHVAHAPIQVHALTEVGEKIDLLVTYHLYQELIIRREYQMVKLSPESKVTIQL